MRWLFPQEKRDIPAKRWLGISLRTLHLFGMAGLAGAYLFQQPESSWYPYLLLTVITGLLMAAMEVYSDGIWLVQLRGTAIVFKLMLLSTVLWWFEQPNAYIYFSVIVISGVVSHAPGKLRYYSIWHRRVITEPLVLAANEVKDCGG